MIRGEIRLLQSYPKWNFGNFEEKVVDRTHCSGTIGPSSLGRMRRNAEAFHGRFAPADFLPVSQVRRHQFRDFGLPLCASRFLSGARIARRVHSFRFLISSVRQSQVRGETTGQLRCLLPIRRATEIVSTAALRRPPRGAGVSLGSRAWYGMKEGIAAGCPAQPPALSGSSPFLTHRCTEWRRQSADSSVHGNEVG